MRSAFDLPYAHEMCVLSQNRHPVDLGDVHVFWRTLTVGDEEGVHSAHEDPERPDALRYIDESLEAAFGVVVECLDGVQLAYVP
ncbi:hypothetical protein Dimus_003132 [Dionaea muscipula]